MARSSKRAGRRVASRDLSLFTAKEIISLKALAGKPATKWWSNYPLIISSLAFILSLTTSIISIYTSHQKNINDQLSQLSSAMQTLQDLNLKQIEVHEKYKNTEYENQAGGLLANEINNTLSIGRDLAFKLGSNASTAALTTIGLGLYGLGDVDGAKKLFELSLGVARSANDESIALRWLGVIDIRNEKTPAALQEGQAYFLRATKLEETHPALFPEAVLWLKATAQIQWAGALALSDCTNARQHFAVAVELLKSPLYNLDLTALRGNLQAQTVAGIGGVAACKFAPAPQ